MRQILKHKLLIVACLPLFLSVASISSTSNVLAAPSQTPSQTSTSGDVCGGPKDNPVTTSINIGCVGKGNPIADATFAVIRFLSAGVGLVIIGSLVYAGIQYTTATGDPQATAKAIARMRANLVALLIFIFGYALLGYLIPAGFLK